MGGWVEGSVSWVWWVCGWVFGGGGRGVGGWVCEWVGRVRWVGQCALVGLVGGCVGGGRGEGGSARFGRMCV